MSEPELPPLTKTQELVGLHIAMFSDTYFPYISGVVRSVERLSEALRERGHSVSIFGPRYWGHQDEDNCGIERCLALPLYPPANIVLAVPNANSMIKRISQLKIDVIHSHSPFIMGLTAVQAAQQLQIPVVFTHHSVYHEYAVYAPKPLRRKAEKIILNWLNGYVHRVDAVIAPSTGTRDFIKSTYGIDATVISNPIAAPAISMNRPNTDAPPVLLFVGRLGKEKNVPLLLRSFAVISKQSNAQLVLVGDGPERGNLERTAEDLGISEHLTITGFLPYSEVSKWYQKAALFVFPSYNETQGMVILEALGHGVPAVAVESEASRAALESCQAGMITKAEPEPMAQAVLDLLQNPSRLATMGERGCRHAQHFTAAHVAEDMDALYSDLVARKRIRMQSCQ